MVYSKHIIFVSEIKFSLDMKKYKFYFNNCFFIIFLIYYLSTYYKEFFMKKLYLSITAIIFAIALFSCNKSDLSTNSGADEGNLSNPKGGNITTTANPAIVWRTSENINKTTVDVFWVMDAEGANQTRLYNPSVTKGQKIIVGLYAPHWSPDGGSICFTMSGLCKLDVTLVNGVPTATNVKKLFDDASNNAQVYDSYWSFGLTNEIIYIVANKSDGSERIQAISGNGGTPTTIYTVSSNYILRWLTVSPDGSKIAFTLLEKSTGNKYLKVINRSDGSEAYSIQYNSLLNSILQMDWARTSGSNTIAMAGVPIGSSTYALYTIDVTNPSSLTLVRNDGGRAPSWSPDDSKIVYGDTGTPDWYIKTVTLSNGALTTLSNSNLNALEMHWKK
jgi:Tol biopolymer transport system component